MSQSKHFEKFAWSVTALMLVITILFMNGSSLGIQVSARTMGYETRLFDNSRMHTIDIVMDDWDDLIANAADEEYYNASIVIDGEAYKNVGIRAKGNTSLSNVASMGSERYSLKIEFDHYDSTKTYYGLDKLCLNNLIQDSTMMKDYLTYTLMNEFGVNAPLCSFTYITVNGNDWGMYLAVEGIEDAFLTRNYGSDHGELYKPDSMSFGGGRGNGKDFDMNEIMENFDFSDVSMPQFPNSMADGDMQMYRESGDMKNDMGNIESPNMNSGIPQMSDTDLPNLEDTKENDLGDLSFGGKDLGKADHREMGGFGSGMGSSDVKLQYIDDELDSYSNIWDNAKTNISEADKKRLIESLKSLYEYDNIEDVVDIDAVLKYFVVHNYVVNGDSYTGSMVHNYYLYEKDCQLSMIPWDYNLAFGTFAGGNASSTVNEPIDSPTSDPDDRPMWGWILSDEKYTEMYHEYFSEFLKIDISQIIDSAYELIKDYVEKDPTKFYDYDEFEKGVSTLREFCKLRSESIEIQLENNETYEAMNYSDASHITLSDMGSMDMGKNTNMNEMPNIGQMLPEGFGADGSNGEIPNDTARNDRSDKNFDNFEKDQKQEHFEGMNTPDMQLPNGSRTVSNVNSWILVGISFAVLCIGIIIAKIHK